MTFPPSFARFFVTFIVIVSGTSLLRAQDPSIDRLLSKLPPPEKFQKSPLERALQQEDPALRDPLLNDIASAARGGSFARAMDLTRKLIARYPHSPGALCLQGVLAFSAHQYGEASSNFHRALVERPNYSFAHFGLAAVELDQNHFTAAMPHLQQFARLEPQSTIAWLALSHCALRLGRAQEGATYARRATAISPSSAGAWIQLARAEKAVGHAQQTIAALARATELMPGNADIFAVVGFSYINLNRIAEAISPLERAAKLKPRDYLIQSQLGYCFGQVGRTAEAISHLRTGANLNPTYGPVWEHLGLVYQKLGRHEEAVKAFEKAAQLMPRSPLPLRHLRQEYLALGKTTKANGLASGAQPVPSKKQKRP